MPQLLRWTADDRPEVRSMALFAVFALCLPDPQRTGFPRLATLPIADLPTVVAHLQDPDPSVRPSAMTALEPMLSRPEVRIRLVDLVLPMLRDPTVLTEYPDHREDEARAKMLERLPPAQQERAAARLPQLRYPALGPTLLWLLLPTPEQSSADDQAVIAFLDRDDQTATTLRESLRAIALHRFGEAVNDEALRRVFEQKAMTIFLLQFVSRMALTPDHLDAEKARLITLSNDETANMALRRSAATVAACWTGDTRDLCQPSPEDLRTQPDTQKQVR